jgi:uncharacterized protein YifN (PemK superfamily)
MIATRLNGVARGRNRIRDAEWHEGDLQINEVREPDLKRVMKVAKMTTIFNTYELFEVQILWVDGDKMCLTGFERLKRGTNVVDYAQSWICAVLTQERIRKRTPTH